MPTTGKRTSSRPDRARVMPSRGDETGLPPRGLRHRIRANPALRAPYRVAVFALGLLCIAVGVALAALPGPLTIPPMLLGLWIWSSEFAWAKRFFDTMKAKASEAWAHARAHPVSSSVVTVAGIAAAVAAFWAVRRFDLVDQARAALF